MRYFFSDRVYKCQQSGNPLSRAVANLRWYVAAKGYESYFASVRGMLPAGAGEIGAASLHDGLILTIATDPEGVAVRLDARQCVGAPAPFAMLLFEGGHLLEQPRLPCYWLYLEFHAPNPGSAYLSVLCSAGRLTIEFRHASLSWQTA